MEIVHKSHEHPLFLLSESPSPFEGFKWFKCQLCQTYYLTGFLYNCFLCDFQLDTKCPFQDRESIVSFRKDLTLYHPFHKHQFKLHLRPSTFQCNACSLEDKDLPYNCTSCYYMIHRRCAMLPNITNHDVHPHPLTLSYGLPSAYSREFSFCCDICEAELSIGDTIWIYYCELCRYFIHIKCMKIKKKQIEVDLKRLQLDDLPRLPMSDKSVELIQRFLLKNNSLGNDEHEISLLSHKHPIIYSNDEQILKDENEDGDEVSCDGCLEQILSPPYYHCAECRYFLHLPCAKLPHELQHHSHEHPPMLKTIIRFHDQFTCYLCRESSNGFFFCCTTEGCDFKLDVICASIPKHVEHETHNHPLSQIDVSGDRCRGCGDEVWELCVGCEPCSYYLQFRCLLLRKTMKNRFDSEHRLKLRYPPHSYHPRPFDCAECESAIDPTKWLYHCEECDLSLHVYCIFPFWGWKNTSKNGQKRQIISHPHPLRYAIRASIESPCRSCGNFDYYESYSECETCNFHICEPCFQKIEPSSSTG